MTVERQAVLVLGMHRSGTSALAGVMHLMGYAVGKEVLNAQQGVNERGFFENAELVRVHEQALAVLDSHWSDFRSYNRDDWEREGLASVVARLSGLLESEFAQCSRFVLKDPRQPRLLPLWRKATAGMRLPVSALLIFRHPFEVAQSLQRRDGLGADHALALWLRSILDAERETRGMARAAVAYEELLADWRQCLARASMQLGHSLTGDGVSGSTVDEFLSVDLKHHDAADWGDGDEALREAALTLYGLLQRSLTVGLDGMGSDFDRCAEVGGQAIAGSEAGAQAMAFQCRLHHEVRKEWQARDAVIESMNESTREAVSVRDAEIVRLTKLLSGADAHRQELALTIDARDAEIVRLGSVLAQADAHRQELAVTIDARDAEIVRLGSVLAQADSHRQQLAIAVEARDGEIGRLGSALAGADAHRLKLLADLGARDEQVQRLTAQSNSAVRLRDEEIRRLQSILAEQEAHNRALTAAVGERDGIISHYQANEHALAERLEASRRELADAQAELTRLRSQRLVRLAERVSGAWNP